jgi:hypothetical protein
MGIFGKDSNGHKIFSTGRITDSKNVVQKVRYNREQLISDDVAYQLNTYLNFGVFPTFADTYADKYNYDKSSEKVRRVVGEDRAGTPGVRSIFNRAGAIIIGTGNQSGPQIYDVDVMNDTHWWRLGLNVPLMDTPKSRRMMRQKLGCSVKELVKASQSGMMGQATYAYSDFMYCKHLGKVPNNYMITLRRFATPVSDYITSSGPDLFTINDEKELKDSLLKQRESKNPVSIGCMVTWMGVSGNEMSNVLKYSFKMPFKEQQAELQDSKSDADANTSVIGGMFNMFDSTYRQQYMSGQAGNSANAAFAHFGINLGNPPYSDHLRFKDRNKVYGPIDAVKSTYIRSDEGLVFNQKLTLVFEYELRSYNGINPRQAMLDLLSNILNVTYITGSFWGGGIKSYGAHQSNIFANLNIFKCRGGFTDFIDAFAKDLSDVGTKVKEGLGIDFSNPASILQALKGIGNTIGGMLMGGMLNKLGRPQKAMYNSFLSPSPIGFWHVMIGNPRAPIMSMGNMIITNVTVEHNGPLGVDNFPTELKVTVELDRGKPRDLRDIEKMYMNGNDRIYAPMTDKVFDMYKNAIDYHAKRANRGTSVSDMLTSGIEILRGGANSVYNPGEKTTSAGEVPTDAAIPVPTITQESMEVLAKSLIKNFGSQDIYSIYLASTEQEYGAGKKKGNEVTSDDNFYNPAAATTSSTTNTPAT